MNTLPDTNTAENEDAETVRLAAQKRRSIWLGFALFGFVLLIGITSALQLKANIQKNSNANIEQIAGEGA